MSEEIIYLDKQNLHRKETPYPIFQIGFNKCGTTSMHALFWKSGYKSFHWENGQLARVIIENLASKDILKGYPRNSFFNDMEESSANECILCQYFFKEFFETYPDSKFILNIRDKDKWIKSRFNHTISGDERRWRFGDYDMPAYAKDSMFEIGDKLNINFRKHVNTDCSDGPELLKKIWSYQWDSHINAVKDFFAKSPERLLIFDIERDSIDKFIEFFKDIDLDKNKWEQNNKT